MRNTTFVILLVTLGSISPNAFAYLDPSTGSMIISAIIGVFATALLAIKAYWYKLISLLRGGNKSERKNLPKGADPNETE